MPIIIKSILFSLLSGIGDKKHTIAIGKSFSIRLSNGYGPDSYQFPDTALLPVRAISFHTYIAGGLEPV